jgi:hypothetical protein
MNFKFLFYLFTFLTVPASAVELDLIWTDSNGLAPVGQCRVFETDKIPLSVSRSGLLLNSKGKTISSLPSLSILADISGDEKSDGLHIEVAGVALNSEQLNLKSAAKRGWGSARAENPAARENLFVDRKSLQEFGDYFFVIDDPLKVSKLTNYRPEIKSTLWQTLITDEAYNVAECCTNETSCQRYVLFNVHANNATQEFLSIVGVRPEETRLFENFYAYPNASEPDETEEVANEQGSSPGEKTTDADASDDINSVVLAEGIYEDVICLANRADSLNVVAKDYTTSIYNLQNGDEVRLFQSFNNSKYIKKLSDNTEVEYLKIKTARGIGFVPKNSVQQKSNCDSLETAKPTSNSLQGRDPEKDLLVQNYFVCTESGEPLRTRDLEFGRLSDKMSLPSGEKIKVVEGRIQRHSGIRFVKIETKNGFTGYVGSDFLQTEPCPVAASSLSYLPVFRPTGFSYLPSGQRPGSGLRDFRSFVGYNSDWGVFGARRDGGGRCHPAKDLYQKRGSALPSKQYSYDYFGGPFRAIQDGRILRKPNDFYLGTFEMAVQHTDGKIARYGEIYGTELYKSDQVSAGQKLGYVKWVGSKKVPPMLHLEFYNSDAQQDAINDRLTVTNRQTTKINGRPTKRQNSLFNRTNFIKQLEMKAFGLGEK